jgi:hypothetical protein
VRKPGRLTPGRVAAAALLLLTAAGGCRKRRDLCGDPLQTAQAFVDRMEAGDRQGALQLLSADARARLAERAADAARTLGHEIAPADILVPERSVLPRAQWLSLRSEDGREAWIEVRPPTSADAGPVDAPWTSQRLVREGGCWKIDLFHVQGDTLAASAPENR